ncbi:MAG TPA: DNA-binding domain-containing protein [bacterium]|nr:DNA-binding domain-containing protein [bacterium]
MWLENAQAEFIQYLYEPKPSGERGGRVRELFLSPDRPDPGNGLKVYRRNLLFGMLQALKDTYGFTRALVGENNFNFLGREYIYANPSRHPDLTAYGGDFAAFLRGRAEVAAWPFLADVAALEWARDRAFYAGPPVAEGVLAPSLSLVESAYGILGPFELFQKGGLAALPQDPFRSGPEALVVWAEAGEPRQARVTRETAEVVRSLIGFQGPLAPEDLAFLRTEWFSI